MDVIFSNSDSVIDEYAESFAIDIFMPEKVDFIEHIGVKSNVNLTLSGIAILFLLFLYNSFYKLHMYLNLGIIT